MYRSHGIRIAGIPVGQIPVDSSEGSGRGGGAGGSNRGVQAWGA